jgi:hypothetical protein
VPADRILADAMPTASTKAPRRGSLEQAARLEQGEDPAELRRILRSISNTQQRAPAAIEAGRFNETPDDAANDIGEGADKDWEIRF